MLERSLTELWMMYPRHSFTKLGKAMKLVEKYKQSLVMDSKGIEVEKQVP